MHDGRQVHFDRLEAGVHLARHARDVSPLISSFDAKVACGRSHSAASICPVWLQSSSIACLPRMTSRGLSRFDELEQHACDGRRLDRRVGLDEDRAVRAHRERVAQLLLGLVRPDADREDFVRLAALAEAQRLLERDLVEGIGAHLDAVGHDAGAVRTHAHAHVEVDDALDADQNPAHAVRSVVRGAWYRIHAWLAHIALIFNELWSNISQ